MATGALGRLRPSPIARAISLSPTADESSALIARTGSSSLTLIGTLLPTVKRKPLSSVWSVRRRDGSATDRSSAIIFRRSHSCHRPPRPSIGRWEAFAQRERPRQARRTRSKNQSGTPASRDSRPVGIHVAFELRHVEATRLLCTCEAARIRPRRRHRYLRTTEIYALLSLLT